MGTDYVYNYCYTGYNHILSHFCPGRCSVCMQAACTHKILYPAQTVIVPAGLRFVSRNMKRSLRGVKESPATVSSIKNVPSVSMCYMQVLEREMKHNNKLIFYDFEMFVSDHGEHTPFLICTKRSDGKCWSSQGEDCAEKFLAHFRRPLFKGSIFIVHNAIYF